MAVKALGTDKCPHCGVTNRFEGVKSTAYTNNRMIGSWLLTSIDIENGAGDGFRELTLARCTNPDCRKAVLILDSQMLFPLSSQRPSVQTEVPENIAQDYTEACLVEPLSKKAAAALARRCLQSTLHDQDIKKANLETEIEEAIMHLPSHLADDVDAIRQVGNFGAHPLKSTSTGEIVEVEPEEAEYMLDTLYDLFDYYYVKPAKSAAKRVALEAKLTAAGKNITLKKKTN